MKDIDRNINSPLFEISKISNTIDTASEILVNFTNIYTAVINGAGVRNVELQPGEYYYRHVAQPIETDNSSFFIVLYGKSSEYPLCSYYIQSPLTAVTNLNSVVPYHFIVDTPIKLTILVQNVNTENAKIKSTIQIKKRVK